MGKLILCSGIRTTNPYTFTRGGIKLYSMEELCYYLYHYIHLIEESMIDNQLFDFMERELDLAERASKLRMLKKQNADLKTLVTFIMCTTDYYTESEIKELLSLMDEIAGMSMVKRNIIKAKYFLKEHQYDQAAAEYVRILHSPDATELTPEEYGNLYHNLAVARLHITGLKESSKLFAKAYEHNHREESLKQYLYTLRLMSKEEEYHQRAEQYSVAGETDEAIRNYISEVEKDVMSNSATVRINKLEEYKNQGKINEFYRGVNEIIDTWKAKVRQG